MRRAPRRRPERLANDFGDVVIANLARRARTRLVEKAVNPALGEPPPPFAYRVGGCAEAQADVSVFHAFSREQDDTRPLRSPCAVFRRDARLSRSRRSIAVKSIATAVLPIANPPRINPQRIAPIS